MAEIHLCPEMRRGESHFPRVGELHVQGRIQTHNRRVGAFDYPFQIQGTFRGKVYPDQGTGWLSLHLSHG